MAHFRAQMEMPTNEIVKLKFEQELEPIIKEKLITELAKVIIESDKIQIHNYQLNPGPYNFYEPATKFYVNVEVENID